MVLLVLLFTHVNLFYKYQTLRSLAKNFFLIFRGVSKLGKTYLCFLKSRIQQKPWISIPTWFNYLDDFRGIPHFRKSLHGKNGTTHPKQVRKSWLQKGSSTCGTSESESRRWYPTTRWCPSSLAKLEPRTPISRLDCPGRYIELVFMGL